MNPGVLEALNEKLSPEGAKKSGDTVAAGGVGLINVAERIRNRYGDVCQIRAESTPGMGTIVILRIPYEPHLEEDGHEVQCHID